MSNHPELVQVVAAFVPPYAVQRIVGGHPPKPGDTYVSEGATIFADVAGFTPMAERLARLMRDQAHQAEARGAEELSRIINQAFSAMMTPIHERGGTVIRFSGDALAAYFERPAHLSPSDVVASTLACAHAMQAALSPFAQVQVEDEVFPVSVKIGVGYGSAIFLVVGDGKRDMESALVGDALKDAAAAEGHAKRGQVVLAPSAWSLLPASLLPPDSQIEHSGNSLASLEPRVIPPLEKDVRLLSPNVYALAGLGAAALEHVLRDLSPYLPQSIYDRLLLAQGDLPGDYRRVTNLFVFFEGLESENHLPGKEEEHSAASLVG